MVIPLVALVVVALVDVALVVVALVVVALVVVAEVFPGVKLLCCGSFLFCLTTIEKVNVPGPTVIFTL